MARTYTTPILRSAEALERRINNAVRNGDRGWYVRSGYYRLSTLYVFAEHLAWIRLVERRFGFLPFESTRKGKVFGERLNGIFKALASYAYFRWAKGAKEAEVEADRRARSSSSRKRRRGWWYR